MIACSVGVGISLNSGTLHHSHQNRVCDCECGRVIFMEDVIFPARMSGP